MKLSFACYEKELLETDSFMQASVLSKMKNEMKSVEVMKTATCGTFILRSSYYNVDVEPALHQHTQQAGTNYNFCGETHNSPTANSTRTQDAVTLCRIKMMTEYDIMPTMVVVLIAETPIINLSPRLHSWLKSSEFSVARNDKCLGLEKIQMTERSRADIMPWRKN